MSIKFKILLVCGMMIIGVATVLGLNFCKRSEEDMTGMGVAQARIAARIAANEVDGDFLESLVPGDETGEAYQAMLTKLREVQKICGVKFLYVLVTDRQTVMYAMDTDDGLTDVIGVEFEESYEELASAFGGEEYVQGYIDETEEGDLITAYVPIYNSKGEVAGLLGGDYDASTILEAVNTTKSRVIFIAGIGLAAALVLLSLVVGQIMRGLQRVNGKIYELVHNEGDLTQTLDVRSGDELELMANNLNELLAYIRKIMLQISANSRELNSSSKMVSQSMCNSESDVMDVSAAMEEMSASVEETTASLNQVSDAITAIDERVNDIAAKAQQGNAAAENIAGKAQELHTDAEQKQRKVQELAQQMTESVNEKIEQSKSVEKINELTENIIAITSQTNLLALNASIEAARAGEAGKGFAVVADEIGKLAVNSAETASQIKDVSKQVITSVEGLAVEAENMVRFVEETALGGYRKLLEASEDYSNDAENIHQVMQNFAEHAQNLGTAMEGIRDSVTAVNVAMEENAKGIVGVAETATKLSECSSEMVGEAEGNLQIAEQLASEVSKFKLE